MRDENFNIFFEALIKSTEKIEKKYFKLPIAAQHQFVFRERAYCYELYHQLRQMLPEDFPYILSGEVNKRGHPIVSEECGGIIPDFLVHNPGHMGEKDNLVVVEVKTIQSADCRSEGKGFLRDIDVMNCMTGIENGYYKGIILVFGADYGHKKRELIDVFNKKCDVEKVTLLFHESELTKAVKVSPPHLNSTID